MSEPRVFQHYIDGEWVDGSDGRTIDSVSPGDGAVWARYQDGSPEDVDRAVRAAHRAFHDSDWGSRRMGPERAEILRRIAREIAERQDDLAETESLDSGKPIVESSIIDVPMAAQSFSFYADSAARIGGSVVPVASHALDFTLREPIGVSGLIVPWNFPILIASWKVAPALAAGCTVVLKPSELTSATALLLAEICHKAGVPRGVLNVVTGYGNRVGQALCEHPMVSKISITGSTATGKAIVRAAAGTLKSVTTELGGKNALIVFPDANLDKAIAGALLGSFMNQGEACIASSRLLVHEDVHDAFVDALVARARKIKVGPPLDHDTRLGALVSRQHLEKVESYVALGKSEGAKAVLPGGRPRGDELGDGYYLAPTVFTGVAPGMRIAQEEIFGPVVGVMSFRDEDEAVRLANATIYGLVAGVYAQDVTRALRVAQRLEAGTVWVNAYGYLKTEAPFGGYKQSGTGRDLSEHALEHYTQLKNVYVDLEDEQICFYE
ncbi:MAG: aldehyde dehydrogenase family protein [Acidobacteriota bacterium]